VSDGVGTLLPLAFRDDLHCQGRLLACTEDLTAPFECDSVGEGELSVKIDLYPDIERFVLDQVTDGMYQSPADVVTDALFRLWEHALSDPLSPLADDVVARSACILPGSMHDTNVLELTSRRQCASDCVGDARHNVDDQRRLVG